MTTLDDEHKKRFHYLSIIGAVMDALAGYGSDSSLEEDVTKTVETKPNNSLSALLGADSSASDGDDSDGEDEKSQDVKKSFNSLQSTSQQPVKRQKVQDDQSPKSTLPKPPTTSRSGPSMIHWDIDYLAKTEGYVVQCGDGSENNTEVSQKLERLAATLNGSYADHLKKQHEFHNPRFFESVVDHFGIKNPLGSHAMHSNNTKFVDSETQISPVTDGQSKNEGEVSQGQVSQQGGKSDE